jgi:hypothetical protein
MIRIFERKLLRMLYGAVNDNGVRRTGYSNEVYTLYNEPDRVKEVKVGRMRCLEHLFRMQELAPCRKLTAVKPEGCRRVGKPELRWFESSEEDVKKMGVRNWRRE